MTQRLQYTIDSDTGWRARTPTPPRRAKPAGVIGAGMIGAATVRERVLRSDGPPLTQRVSLRDTDREAITERSSGRCVKGPPPVDPGELEFLAVDPVTRTASRAGARAPYTRDYAGPHGGRPAHYMLHWPALDATARCQGVNSKGETGPPALDGPQRTQFVAARRPLVACQGWSETATATIGA